ncbi:MAG: cytochrome P450 [Gemmatimonadota bacterium]|nr:cytochrome P450 [Gemmatimonadota bacterium]
MVAEPPGPTGWLPGRQLLPFRRNPLRFLEQIARRHGDVAHFRFGPLHVYLLSHPDHVREVLVTRNRNFIKSRALQRARVLLGEGLLTSEEPFHLRQRRLAQPAFHRDRIAAYGSVMSAEAQRTANRWRHGETLDVSREMTRLTLSIVGKTLFDADVKDEADEIGAALTDALSLFGRLTNPFGELLDRLPVPGTLRMRRARERLDATIFRMIREHRKAGVDRGDLLSMLMLARDTEGDGTSMTDEQLRDEALTIFLAGHETTANALSWTLALLALRPEAEARLQEELDAALSGRPPEPGDLPALPYTRMVLAESMRLYPPAWTIGRQPLEDFEVGGYHIRAGSIVMLSPWVVHRDPRFFPDPERFLPERWTAEDEEARHRFAYFPFGAGPRKCIGEGFAWMEGMLVLAALLQQWRLRLAPGQRLEPEPLITLRPRGGMRMRLERREASSGN